MCILKNSKEEKTNQNQFTLIMAIVDFIPVIIFCISGIFVYYNLHSIIFLIGIILSTIAGLSKASWKLIISITKKDLKIMTKIFHIMLPLGFVIMLVSIPFAWSNFIGLIKTLFIMPSFAFSIIGCACMCLMAVFAVVLDSKKSSLNWIEQCTNTVAQIFFLIAVTII